MSTDIAPAARWSHVGVWSGTELIVWGGESIDLESPILAPIYFVDGGRYNPDIDDWSFMNWSTPTLAARKGATAVWTGSEMIVWGGSTTGYPPIFADDGARFDPVSNVWRPVASVGAPTGRTLHTAVWTGSDMIVWGGVTESGGTGTGSRYDPSTDSWATMSAEGAPEARCGHTAVWTGSEMIVWGGTGACGTLDSYPLGTGARYDPASDTWIAMSLVGAPSPRAGHTAVWTGDRVIVWGPADGGIYDPATDAWSAIATAGAPSARAAHVAVWTGSEMFVWGQSHPYDDDSAPTGGLYDPSVDSWQPTSTCGTPPSRWGVSAVWSGSRVLVWGGHGPDSNHGGIYSPA